jgi:predicted RNase H-like HicB family nuclease
MDYVAYLHKEKSSDYGVSFPDFPGVITAGKTLDEARKMAAEALNFHILGLMKDGEEIPAPTPLDDLVDDPSSKKAFIFVVPVNIPDERVRINITARKSQMKEIDRLAKSAGMTRSAFVIQRALTVHKILPGTSRRLKKQRA